QRARDILLPAGQNGNDGARNVYVPAHRLPSCALVRRPRRPVHELKHPDEKSVAADDANGDDGPDQDCENKKSKKLFAATRKLRFAGLRIKCALSHHTFAAGGSSDVEALYRRKLEAPAPALAMAPKGNGTPGSCAGWSVAFPPVARWPGTLHRAENAGKSRFAVSPAEGILRLVQPVQRMQRAHRQFGIGGIDQHRELDLGGRDGADIDAAFRQRLKRHGGDAGVAAHADADDRDLG